MFKYTDILSGMTKANLKLIQGKLSLASQPIYNIVLSLRFAFASLLLLTRFNFSERRFVFETKSHDKLHQMLMISNNGQIESECFYEVRCFFLF